MANPPASPLRSSRRDFLFGFMDSARSWALKYFIYLLAFIGLALAGLGGILLKNAWDMRQNVRAETQLYSAKKKLIQAEKQAGGNILEFDSSGNFFASPKKAKTLTPAMRQELKNYTAVIKKHLTFPPGALAAVETAHFLNLYGESAQGLALLEQARGKFQKKTLPGFLLAFQTGTALMNAQKYPSALKHFKWLEQNPKAQWLHADVLLHTGLTYEKLKKYSKARQVYQKLKMQFPNTAPARRAVQYLNLLKIRTAASTLNKAKAP